MRNKLPYMLLSSVYGVINTYLPIVLDVRQFSKGEIGVLLAIVEITGLTIPFFITSKLDKNGRYGLTMVLLGLDMGLSLFALMQFRSFLSVALCLGIFAVGLKGLVPILDGFTTKILGNNQKKYGSIRVFGSAGFVCMTIFLQIFPPIQGENIFPFILIAGITSLLFSLSVLQLPSIFDIHLLQAHTAKDAVEGNGGKSPIFSKPFLKLLWLLFFASLGLVPSQRFFSLYIEEYVKINAAAILWALAALAEIPFMLFSGSLISRFGIDTLLAVCLTSMTVRNISYIVLPGISGAVFAQLLHSLSFGLFFPLSVIACNAHSNGRSATAMMLLTAANGFANIIGSVIGGYIIDYFGYPALFLSFSICPLIGIGIYFYGKKQNCVPEKIAYGEKEYE